MKTLSPYLPFIGAYIITFLAIAGWLFAYLHRDGVTEKSEWRHDMEFSLTVAFVFGFLGPISIIGFWFLSGKGWTLKPDRVEELS